MANYCRRTFPSLRVINDGWLLHWPPSGRVQVTDSVPREDAERLRAQGGGRPRHPDVIISGQHGRVAVVEIDGSVHDRRTESTERRNAWYAERGIPALVLDDWDVTADRSWRDAVDELVSSAFEEVNR